jgi:hypothetical protein
MCNKYYNMTILEKLLSSRTTSLSDATVKSYRNSYESNIDKIGDHFYFISQKKYLEHLNKLDDSLNTKYSLLNINIMIRNNEGKPTIILVKARAKLSDSIAKEMVEKLDDLELPDYTEYKEKVNALQKTDPQKYIVNSLILKFGFRNKDLNLNLIKNTRKKLVLDDKENYCVVKAKEIEFVINTYKTFKTYGTKKIKLLKRENKQLYNAIASYLEDGHIYLLDKKNMERIAESSLHSQIRGLTNGYGTSSLFKMVVKYYRLKGDLDMLKSLSKTRGTSLDLISSNYNKA